jgi:hypothetical protein
VTKTARFLDMATERHGSLASIPQTPVFAQSLVRFMETGAVRRLRQHAADREIELE